MSWEAFRLTSKSPSELMDVMGPNGVDGLIRDCLMSCWRDLPQERRDFSNWQRRADEVFARNMKVWANIKKPSPEAFFANLLPYPADGHLRQAMVLCHMMLPRGKRPMDDVRKLITRLFQRNLDAWTDDHRIFTRGLSPRPATRKPAAGKSKKVKKSPVRKKLAPKRKTQRKL